MKIDKNYHCFACGVGGDVVDYVSRMFGLSQYDAALKLIEDFSLPVDAKGNTELSVQEKERIRVAGNVKQICRDLRRCRIMRRHLLRGKWKDVSNSFLAGLQGAFTFL